MGKIPPGGGWYLFGVQSLTVICIVFWGVSSTFLLLWLVNKITPLRMEPKDEILGADYTEHNIKQWPRAVEVTANSSSNGRSEESQISQRVQAVQSADDKMEGIYKTYFTDESTADRLQAPARVNLAYQHDVGA
jgi:Ammonium Transporter Family